jgi:hypothetical protein
MPTTSNVASVPERMKRIASDTPLTPACGSQETVWRRSAAVRDQDE